MGEVLFRRPWCHLELQGIQYLDLVPVTMTLLIQNLKQIPITVIIVTLLQKQERGEGKEKQKSSEKVKLLKLMHLILVVTRRKQHKINIGLKWVMTGGI